eukprot:scaffold13207_cov143-Cylindrotheca_fusiformis.AAC.20
MMRSPVKREEKSVREDFAVCHRPYAGSSTPSPTPCIHRNCRRNRGLVALTNPTLRILIVIGLSGYLLLGIHFLNREPFTAFDNASGSEMISRAISAAVSNVNRLTASNRDVLRNTTSFCLLIKDDGEILNEWIAYHYHVLNMRQLIVAVDPLSETSPEPILKKWEELFGMSIQVWRDEDFMPASFLRGEYDTIKNYVFHFKFPSGIDNTTEGYQEQLTIINNHRHRQHVFVSQCLRSLKGRLEDPRNGNWVAHVDSDEYIVLNPEVRENINDVLVPPVPSAGSLLNYLNDAFSVFPSTNLRRKCLLMPRILYIPRTYYGKEKQRIIEETLWNVDRFETLRWEIHRDLSEPSGFQKAIVDVAAIEKNHSIFEDGRIHSVHSPLPPSEEGECPLPTMEPDLMDVYQYPLAVNHYFGSLERYLSRNDTRKHKSIWRKKTRLKGEVSDGWIAGWLRSFVEEHGLEKVSQVLQDYRNLEYQSQT